LPTTKQALIADFSLLFIAISWGYTFVLAKDLLSEMTPLYFQGTRFLLAGLILALWRFRDLRKLDRSLWKLGLYTGFFLFLSFTFQIFGIERTTPGKAGMITGLTVIFVPFLYFLWARTPLQKGPVIGSLLAFFGLCLLSSDGSMTWFGYGDLLVFFCAIAFAIHTVMVDRIYDKEPNIDPLLFAMVQLLVVGGISTALALLFEPVPGPLSPYGWFAYLFECLIGTMLAYIVQIKAQLYTPPTHVTMILSLESLFAFLFSWLIWGEPLTAGVLIGACLMLAGIGVTEMHGIAGELFGRKVKKS